MAWIDYWVIGFFICLVGLPYLAVRYNLLKVKTILDEEFSSKKINEFIILNVLFSLGSFITLTLLAIHFIHKRYAQVLLQRKVAAAEQRSWTEDMVPQITSQYDVTGVSKKRKK